MKALVGAFNQEKALVGAFSVIVQPVVEPVEHYTTLHPGGHLLPQLREGQVHPRRGLLGGVLGRPIRSEKGIEPRPGEYCIFW